MHGNLRPGGPVRRCKKGGRGRVCQTMAKVKRIRQRCGFCGLCQSVVHDLTGHMSPRSFCRDHEGTRSLDEMEMRQLDAELEEEALNPR